MTDPTARRASGGPASVEDIYKQASNFEYDPAIPLRFWLRTASTMQKEAQVYDREGNDEQAYRVLLRHALLVFEKLPKHPEAKESQYKPTLAQARKAAEAGILRLEDIKPRIKKRHDEYVEFTRRRKTQLEALEKQRASHATVGNLSKEVDNLSLHGKFPRESSIYGSKKVLDPSKDQGLAAQLAHREARRRDAARRSVRQAGVTEEEEHERRTGGVWGNWERELDNQGGDGDDLSRRIQEVGRMRNEDLARSQQKPEGPLGIISRSANYHYPTVPQKSSQVSWNNHESNEKRPLVPKKEPLARDGIPSPHLPPQLPPKPHTIRPEIQAADMPPPVPAKFREVDTPRPPSSKGAETPSGQELNSSDYNFPPHAYLENGKPLRTMFIPPGLRTKFLAIASENTRRNIETCGILCGTLISNALFIQKLVIPEQEGTSDTCETVNEGALFDYIDKEDLITLGWIHTHPSQTCFMSSRDLHTHSGYQVMLPESIAIVCAPSKDPSWGVFRLTDPPGLKAILNCSQPGLFHPHSELDTYTDALRPGHVCEIGALEFDVVDLRPGKGIQ